jgi:putative membrane protein PagO
LDSTRTGKPLVIIAYTSMCLIWGSTWIMIKLGLRGAPPMTAVAIRFILAAILVHFIILLRGQRIPRTRAFLSLALFLSLFHVAIPYVLVYWGEQYISAGLTAVLFSTMPINVAILARLLIGDPLTLRKVTGILAGFAGVWVIFSGDVGFDGAGAGHGVVAILLSSLSAGCAAVVAKKYASRYDPLVTLAIPFTVSGFLVLAVAVPVEGGNPLAYDALTWVTIIYLAALGSVAGFAMFFWIIKKIDVTVLSYQTFIIPVLAVMIGWIFLEETVTIRVACGATLIVVGAVLASFQKRAIPDSNQDGHNERNRHGGRGALSD